MLLRGARSSIAPADVCRRGAEPCVSYGGLLAGRICLCRNPSGEFGVRATSAIFPPSPELTRRTIVLGRAAVRRSPVKAMVPDVAGCPGVAARGAATTDGH